MFNNTVRLPILVFLQPDYKYWKTTENEKSKGRAELYRPFLTILFTFLSIYWAYTLMIILVLLRSNHDCIGNQDSYKLVTAKRYCLLLFFAQVNYEIVFKKEGGERYRLPLSWFLHTEKNIHIQYNEIRFFFQDSTKRI